MKVSIKNLNVAQELNNKGMDIDVVDNEDNSLGTLVVTKSGLVWCKGKTKVANGIKLAWPKAVKVFEAQEVRKAKKAAKKATAGEGAAAGGESKSGE